MGTGKTSIKQAIFEGADPKKLVLYPLDPTRGIETDNYDWFDLNLGLFDTSGQELPFLLVDKLEQLKAFDKTDEIIYVLDYIGWIREKKAILEEIREIYQISQIYSKEAHFDIFFHKIDQISQKNKGYLDLIRDEIVIDLNFDNTPRVFFTSLFPKQISRTFNAFSEILSNFSTDSLIIKGLIDKNLQEFSKTICFVTNSKHNIIVQTMSSDFNTKIVRDLQMLVSRLDNLPINLSGMPNEVNLVELGPKLIRFIIGTLSSLNNNLNKIHIFSEEIEKEQISNFFANIQMDLKKMVWN